MRYETTVDVEAPPSVLWTLLSDPTTYPTFSDSFVAVTALGPTALAEGATYRVRQPGIRPMRWSVTEVEDGRSFTWRTAVRGVRTVATHRVEPTATGCRLVLVVEQSGALAGVVGALGRDHTRALVNREAATFAGAAEARAR